MLPQIHPNVRLFALLVAAACHLCCAGCASWNPASLSPWRRDEWAEDEKYGLTFKKRLEELQSVREQAHLYEPAQVNQLARQLTKLYQTSPNGLLREEAIRTLGALPHPASLATLNQASQDEKAGVRMVACRALGQRQSQQAVATLSYVLENDEDPDVRVAAARELGEFQSPYAAQALAIALDDSDPALKYRAVESLRAISPIDHGNDIAAWREYAKGVSPESRVETDVAGRERPLF